MLQGHRVLEYGSVEKYRKRKQTETDRLAEQEESVQWYGNSTVQ